MSLALTNLTPPNSRGGDAQLNRAYIGCRQDVISLVERAPENVLDVGCAQGATGLWLKTRYGCWVSGVELDPRMSADARVVLDEVLVGDLNRTTLAELCGPRRFDLILLGDVLEHVIDPWTTLAHAHDLLTPNGYIITSLPNVGHCVTLLSLFLLRRWPYRDRGIHDRTHLRFFTRKNMLDMYRSAELTLEHESRNLRFFDLALGVNDYARVFDFHPFRTFFTYQYLHRLRSSR